MTIRVGHLGQAVGDSQPERKGQATTVLVVRAGLVDGDEVVLGRHDPAQPDKTADLIFGGRGRSGVVLSVLGPGMQDLLALMDARARWAGRGGPVEHSRNVGLVAGPGANAATCRGMYGVEVLERYSTEGADGLADRARR